MLIFFSFNIKVKDSEKEKFEKFYSLNYYLAGTYDQDDDFKALDAKIIEISKLIDGSDSNANGGASRIFYLALPPTVYMSVSKLLSLYCKVAKYECKAI